MRPTRPLSHPPMRRLLNRMTKTRKILHLDLDAFKYRATPQKTPQYTYCVDAVSQNAGENRGISGGIEGDFSVSHKTCMMPVGTDRCQ